MVDSAYYHIGTAVLQTALEHCPALIRELVASGGSAECIVESENGYSVECGDVEKLERMIEIVKTNGKEKYSPFCRESAMQNYDMRYCYAEYLEIYENLMKNTTSEETL